MYVVLIWKGRTWGEIGGHPETPLTRGQIRGYIEAYRQEAKAEKKAAKRGRR